MANMTTTTTANFIPEIWSDEVVATYKANLVAANLVRGLNHAGKKGDSIHIPNPARNAANAKTAGSDVTAITDTAADIVVSIDQHFEWSMYIEDIASLQAISSMRKFYTDDAGFALADKVDTTVLTELKSAATNDLTGCTTTGWDTTILSGVEALNDNNAPMNGRALMVSPATYSKLLAEPRFSEQAKLGTGTAISTGKVGSIYGVDVYVSTNVGGSGVENAVMFQKDAAVLATQQSVRSQTQYKQEKLADLFTADTVFGVKLVRAGSVVQMTGA